MKSLYLPELDCFIRYHLIEGIEPGRVYLPGLGAPASSLLSTATHPELVGHQSLLIDYLGCGISDTPENYTYTIEKQADLVLRILEKEKIDRCQIIGHSMGGTVGIYMALKQPEIIERLVLAEANIEKGGGRGTKYIASFGEEEFLNKTIHLLNKRDLIYQCDTLVYSEKVIFGFFILR